MPTLLHKDTGLVKGAGFRSDRRVGAAMQAVKVYNRRDVDELVFFDVSASRDSRSPDFSLVDDLADECFMPLTVGGGVRDVEDIARLLAVGADKVSMNSGALCNPSIIEDGARRFGVQCIVVAIDARRNGDGWRVHGRCGAEPTDLDPVVWAKRVEALGAGEIILTSIDRDGTMEGYDLPLIRAVADAVRIPVVASGGAGSVEDAARAVKEGGASAVAAASIYHFTQITPKDVKRHLKTAGVPVRL